MSSVSTAEVPKCITGSKSAVGTKINCILNETNISPTFTQGFLRLSENPRTVETSTTHCCPYKGQNTCLNLPVQIFLSESSKYELSKFTLHTSSRSAFSLSAAPLTVLSPQQESWGLCNPNLVFLEELAYFCRERPLSRAWPQWLCRAPEHVTKESYVSYFKGKDNNQSRTRHDCAVHFVSSHFGFCPLFLPSKVRQRCSK